MTPSELRKLFRSEMSDVAEPYLWSDSEVYQYIDDAQKMFCRLTDGIADASSDATVIPVATDDTWLDLHPAILKIRAATRASDGAPLDVVNFEDLAGRGLRLDGRKGPLRLLITGMEENKLRLAEVAAGADTIQLLVFRLPLVDIDGGETDFEIPAQHHLHLLNWVKNLALLKQDAETFDKSKSQEFEAKFRSYCGQVQIEQQNKRHKVRTVAYGGL